MLAQTLSLYDPDRLREVRHQGVRSTWQAFDQFWREQLLKIKADRGSKTAVLSGPFSSPTLSRLKRNFSRRYSQSAWVHYEPFSYENVDRGMELAFGSRLRPLYRFDRAQTILCLDADILGQDRDALRASKDFAGRRRLDGKSKEMNRLYVAEGVHSLTGSNADHRLPVQSRQIGHLLAAIIVEMGRQGRSFDKSLLKQLGGYKENTFDKGWVRAVAQDLMEVWQ